MRRVNNDTADASGQDSFLDIVANMVGIMILLVMIMGLRASHDARGASALNDNGEPAPPPVAQEELDDAIRKAIITKSDVADLFGRVIQVRQDAMLREQERNAISTYVAEFEQELGERRGKLDQQQQRDYDLRRQLNEAQLTLDSLTREQVSLLSQTADVEVIENQPTPLVHPTEGNELYLMISRAHVAVIPLADLREEFNRDVQQNIWRLREQDHFVASVGPIAGFRLKYFIRNREVTVHSAYGTERTGTVPEFVRCEIVPTMSPLGEPVEQAMLPDSDLSSQLKKLRPDSAVVNIVVYEDNLADLHQLKRHLTAAGFATAEALLPLGETLVFSPNGQKLYAQ